MGWASGSEMANELWQLVRPFVPEEKRRAIALRFYDRFCDEDADAWSFDDELILDAEITDDDEQ